MKKRLLYILAASALLIGGCAKEDTPEIANDDNIMNLVVRGMLVSDEATEYSAVVDKDARTIKIQVPYYLSKTEQIQGDLTKMKVKASLPVGAKFEPSIAGIRDLTKGFESTLVYSNGKKETYTFTAEYRKSDEAQIETMMFSDPLTPGVIAITHPADGGKGKIAAPRSTLTEEGLKSVVGSISPWSTIESDAYDPETKTFDLSLGKDITIISQSGDVRNVYEISYELPKLVEHGIGYSYALFGFQPTVPNPHGFTEGANTSMAYSGRYLVLSNNKDFTQMPVFDRFTGELTDVHVNTEGIHENVRIFAISNDDAGHMVAVSYINNRSSANDPNQSKDKTVRGYVWKDGITAPPTQFLNEELGGGKFTNAPLGVNGGWQIDLFRTISVKGDITSGDAVIATCSYFTPRPVFLFFKDGVMDGNAYIEWPGGSNIAVSLWKSTKVIPLNTDKAALEYFWDSANHRTNIVYSKAKTGFGFDIPSTHWWRGSGTYDHCTRGIGYVEFNGAHLLAINNGNYAGKVASGVNQMYFRCWVSDVGAAPSTGSLQSGFVFDTREGDKVNGTSAIKGTGFSTTGLTSANSFNGEEVLGGDAVEMGDVMFVKSADGGSVQLYMLITDQGLIGYNLTSIQL